MAHSFTCLLVSCEMCLVHLHNYFSRYFQGEYGRDGAPGYPGDAGGRVSILSGSVNPPVITKYSIVNIHTNVPLVVV